MTSYPLRMAALVAAAAAVVAVSSCSTSTQSSPASPSTTATQAASGHNMADVMFAHMMIPHHQQALDLSALVPDRSTNQELITLAATIASEQQPEIDQMQAMLADWGAMPGMSNMPGHGGMGDMPGMGDMGGMGGMGMSGMIDAATVTKLTSLSGQPFDVLWLQSMIVHHQGAIEMAQNEVADGSNPGMVNLAKGMVTAQQAEIDQMQRMLAELGG
ncbi:MAG: DUF305 domain-containing protein [Mycobacterium sp.]|nr:DUF305 domain-containing protein [Mycobacterium sp.]